MWEMGSKQAHTTPLSSSSNIPVGPSGWVPLASILDLPSRSGEGPTPACPGPPSILKDEVGCQNKHSKKKKKALQVYYIQHRSMVCPGH